jgi:hypothetical protein
VTVEDIRKGFVLEGLEAALSERPRLGKARLLDGRQEAFVIALACSGPPAGRASWTMQLLADRLVETQGSRKHQRRDGAADAKRGRSNRGSASSGALPR